MSHPMLPNASWRVLFLSMEDMMGQNGVSAVLNSAGLARFVKNYPPNNLEDCVPFEDYASVVKAVEDFYGPRAAKASLIRVGRATFQYAMKEHPTTLGLAGLALKVLPLNMQMKTVLNNVAAGMTKDLNERRTWKNRPTASCTSKKPAARARDARPKSPCASRPRAQFSKD